MKHDKECISKKELKDILSENLRISIEENDEYGNRIISVSICFEDEVICSDSYTIQRNISD